MQKMEKNVRLRILLVMQLLMEHTDEEHCVSMQDILQWLTDHGVAGERKSIYEDIKALQEYGLDVEYDKELKGYRVIDRQMELPELKMLVDAVQTSKFITRKKTEQLIRQLMEYASVHERQTLRRQIYTEKPKSVTANGYYSLDAIHLAIARNCQISFCYYAWNLKKKLEEKHPGQRYVLSPWLLVWEDENYYLVAWDEELHQFKHFRVDKISDVELLEEEREGKEAFEQLDAAHYSTSHFGMYGGTIQRVNVRFANHLVGVVLDRFGSQVTIFPEEDGYFSVNLEVAVTPQFFGWIFALGQDVRIMTPEVAEQMKEWCEKAAALYS